MRLSGICRIAVAVGLVTGLATGVAMAQEKATSATTASAALTVGNKRFDADKELARLTKRYGLTDDQKTKIEPILAEQQKRVHALGEDDNLTDTEWAGMVRKVHQQTVEKIKLVLTDSQASRYAKDEAKLEKKPLDSGGDEDDGPPGPPPGGGPGGPGGGGPGGGGPPGE